MDAVAPPRRVRADAERSTARILEAAETVLATEPTASLERIGDEAGLARATVHRRFASRQALIDALISRLNDRYLLAFEQARVRTAPPLVALHRLTEIVFELKLSHRFTVALATGLSPEVETELDQLFTRLHDSGAITAPGTLWRRRIYLSLIHEVAELPADTPELTDGGGTPGARSDLLVRTFLGALNG
ncbi:TetR/AcrR family transcriptional regulator [Actinoplanes friuliensis]|jgi:AcrR family transcriptional regulator|uniref:TetR family transcriptional regulator n=1 Tax=Actinoplanes friuliensis DSM 7358 TaxID=1246995 RepID=U5W3L9_9ACTN|nr:helix-turn-helix domain-containing protein [Actinoplanes friuliensis]AGZ42560.1 TetR family transcriptional regulator [Actinoplanes friuliensis DSM 7358]